MATINGTKVNNSRLPDLSTFIQAGINPKTGLPVRMGDCGAELKANIKKLLRIMDEQDAINRFVWYNLPIGLNSQLIERILYYKGQGALFFESATERFYFLPYALDGSIDVYGRFTGIRPLPFNGSLNVQDDDKKKVDVKYQWLNLKRLKPYYDIVVDKDDARWTEISKDEKGAEIKIEKIAFEDGCVLLSDYSKQISQTNISRQILQDPLLDVMADCIPFMRTALLNSAGVQGMRVDGQEAASNVYAASRSINDAALVGEKYVPIVGPVEFQDLTDGNVGKSEEFLLAMQSLDNFRLSLYGLENGGLFQKKSHMLEAEQSMNNGNTGIILQDSLALRQRFCDIVNSIWGLNIWVEASETIMNIDRNLDGQIGGDEENIPLEDEGGDDYDIE